VTVQNHALKPRHDIGKQRAGAVPALIVRVPDRDEPGDPFVRRDAGQVKLIKIGAKFVRNGRYVAIVRRRPAGLTRGPDLISLCVPRREGPALPKSVERGNLSLDKAVIRTSSGSHGWASPQPCNAPRRVAGREKVFA
jgi:hypothetical protein